MNRRLAAFITFASLLPYGLFSQTDSTSGFVLNPAGQTFPVPKGNIEEPRIGVFKFLESADMKVDVGNAVDLLAYENRAASWKLAAAIDFMAYALTTGAEGLRLQVDAIDGFFGGHLALATSSGEESFQARLRIIHHSAHFVDGHIDPVTGTWIDGRAPIPMTKDFGELVGAFARPAGPTSYRIYGGFGYATLVRPAEFGRWSFVGGGEIARTIGACLGDELNAYLLYNVAIEGTPSYSASHHAQAGMKFGAFYGKGASVFVAYYAGTHMSGEYYDVRLSTAAIGFSVDFP